MIYVRMGVSIAMGGTPIAGWFIRNNPNLKRMNPGMNSQTFSVGLMDELSRKNWTNNDVYIHQNWTQDFLMSALHQVLSNYIPSTCH